MGVSDKILIRVIKYAVVGDDHLRVHMPPALTCFAQAPAVVAAGQVVGAGHGDGFVAAAVVEIIQQRGVVVAGAGAVAQRVHTEILGGVIAGVAVADVVDVVINTALVEIEVKHNVIRNGRQGAEVDRRIILARAERSVVDPAVVVAVLRLHPSAVVAGLEHGHGGALGQDHDVGCKP